MSFLTDLRELAQAAMAGDPLDSGQLAPTGRWEAYFTIHGDPYVVEEGRGRFAQVAKLLNDSAGTVAEVATGPADYGRARAQFIAAVDPVTVIGLLDELESLRAAHRPTIDSTPEASGDWGAPFQVAANSSLAVTQQLFREAAVLCELCAQPFEVGSWAVTRYDKDGGHNAHVEHVISDFLPSA